MNSDASLSIVHVVERFPGRWRSLRPHHGLAGASNQEYKCRKCSTWLTEYRLNKQRQALFKTGDNTAIGTLRRRIWQTQYWREPGILDVWRIFSSRDFSG